MKLKSNFLIRTIVVTTCSYSANWNTASTPRWRGYNVDVCQNRDGHGTKPRNWKVSLNSSSFSTFIRECLLLQRAHTERPRAPLDRPFRRRREPLRSVLVSCKAFPCAETSSAFCNSALGPAAIATPPGLASQADRR